MLRVFGVFRTFMLLLAFVPLVAQPAVVFAQDGSESAEEAGDGTPTVDESQSDATPDSEESSDDYAEAEAPAELSGAKVAWMLTSSALVLMMTAPGLALFYGGLVRPYYDEWSCC